MPLAPLPRGTSLDDWVAAQAGAGAGDAGDLRAVFFALASATRRVAAALARAGLDDALGAAAGGDEAVAQGRDAPKQLDVVANDIMKVAMAATGVVGLLASEEDAEVVVVPGASSSTPSRHPYVAVFDPLDGSSNVAACIPTGTIWGLHQGTATPPSLADALAPASSLVASGYALYSSSTLLVLSTGGDRGTHGFTLDPATGAWLLSHPAIRAPRRGQIYSLNDARYADWPPPLRAYIDAVRSGRGQSGKQYAARYVCSLVADLHRTLLYGGWAGNPRPHLRRVYECGPLAHLTVAAGGAATDGVGEVVAATPASLHERAPFFAGSADDVAELLTYGDVRQGAKKYDV